MTAHRLDSAPRNGTTRTRTVWVGYLVLPTPSRWQRLRAALRMLREAVR